MKKFVFLVSFIAACSSVSANDSSDLGFDGSRRRFRYSSNHLQPHYRLSPANAATTSPFVKILAERIDEIWKDDLKFRSARASIRLKTSPSGEVIYLERCSSPLVKDDSGAIEIVQQALSKLKSGQVSNEKSAVELRIEFQSYPFFQIEILK